MNSNYTYFIILAAAFTGPLLLSFDKKVAFYRKWKYVFPAMIFPAILYITWDIFFTAKGVWSFNANYITGIKWNDLPIEEILFFFIVPYCCVFIYECILTYFPSTKRSRAGYIVLLIVAIALLITGLLFYDRYYTGFTFILTAVCILALYCLRRLFPSFHATAFLIAYMVILIPFMIMNGLLTAIPVVLYNDAENLGIRIYTIPFEDIFYGMLLVLLNIVIYERLRSGK